MSKITVLSEDLINKIAAGEVIERPASVVKELVENALDAHASRITIEIKDCGKELIVIRDNGEGMEEEDARRSILRHATSKIRDDTDLFSIHTLGFRGEALASIAAVSQFSLTTKTAQQSEAFTLRLDGGKQVHSGFAVVETGTTVEVKNLFYNTPARKKFLKGDPVELRHIIDVVMYYALAHPAVAFRLTHDNRELLHAPLASDLKSRIASVYGVAIAKDLLEINHQEEGLNIFGYITTPYNVRNDKNQQALFVNGRWVKNEDVSQAVYDAYHSLLFVNKHPIFVLQLTIDPGKIDVNVHPTKSFIKFEQKEHVGRAILTAVKEALRWNNLIPLIDVKVEQQRLAEQPQQNREGKTEQNQVSGQFEGKYPFEPTLQTVFSAADTIVGSSPPEFSSETSFEAQVNTDHSTPTVLEQQEWISTATLPALKLLGQIHKTFFIAETEGGLFFIDQHAAHERVLYEKYMQQLLNKRNAVQRLLQPEILEFSAGELVVLTQFQGVLEQLGFTLELFGSNAYKITTIPSFLGRVQPKEMLFDLIAHLREGKNKASEFQETIITRMACRSAVMAGEELTSGQMEGILQQLAETEMPFTCPHGRPTMIKTTAEELEKKFRRK